MKIHVLGTGCATCSKLYTEVERALAQTGVSAELCKVDKLDEIVKFGAAFTPSLVIDGAIKSQGKLPELAQIVSWLTEATDS